jgi:hypothetical protein
MRELNLQLSEVKEDDDDEDEDEDVTGDTDGAFGLLSGGRSIISSAKFNLAFSRLGSSAAS